MLRFVDRKKNIIRRSGENIAAAEVEAVLQVARHGETRSQLLPSRTKLREEEVFACVILTEAQDAAVAADTLFQHCNRELAYFKVPGWICFVDELPTTGTQKIQKHDIFLDGNDPRTVPGVFDMRRFKKRTEKAARD